MSAAGFFATAEAGSIKDALPFIEGARQLAELGLDLNMKHLAEEMASGQVMRLAATKQLAYPRQGRRALSHASPKGTKEEASVDE